MLSASTKSNCPSLSFTSITDTILLAASSLHFVGAFVYVLLALRNSQERTPVANMLLMGTGFILQCFVLHLRGQILHGLLYEPKPLIDEIEKDLID